MSFVKMPEKKERKFQLSGKKKVWFKWIPGIHKIRLLDNGIEYVHVHWMGSGYVKCLGDTCPVCKENFRIINEAKAEGLEYKEYRNRLRNRTERYFANVLDLTDVKICPKCGNEIHKKEDGTWPDACDSCGAILTTVEPQPSNTVKIFAKGRTLFDNFNTFAELYDKPVNSYNIAVIVKDPREVSVTPLLTEDYEVTYDKEALYNLPDDGILELTAEELVQVMNGVQIRDVLKARSMKKSSNTDAEKRVAEIFND